MEFTNVSEVKFNNKDIDELMIGDELVWSSLVHLNMDIVSKIPSWITDYRHFLEYNTKSNGNLAINSLGLVGGAFVIDDPLTSYTPPTTSTSEAQLLTIRGALQNYLLTKEKRWLDMAEALTNALLNYYYISPEIPETPDKTWVPHWLVNVTEPFVSREFFLNGSVNFVNGVGVAKFNKIFRIFSVRASNATLQYDWAPDSPVIGTEYKINHSEVQYGKSTATIYLDDTTFTGSALIAYSSETGPVIAIGDRCEAYPVWRPLDEGEVACAIDTLPWAMDVYKLWYKVTSDNKWLNALESTKLAMRVASDVTNEEHYIKGGNNGSPVLIDGVTSYSDRSPVETYTNLNNLVMVDYPASAGTSIFGTWVGSRVPFNKQRYIEARLGSNIQRKIRLVLDEDDVYDINKRWVSDFYLKGKGLTAGNLETISFLPEDFYKADNIKWGIGYDKAGNGDVVKSGNSTMIVSDVIGDINGKFRKYKNIKFTRGDEGGWLGWSQYLFALWEHSIPYNICYRTNNELNFVINDSQDVKWTYRLPKTGGKWSTIPLTKTLFTSDTGGTMASGQYRSTLVEAIDESGSIDIDYIGEKTYMLAPYYTTVNIEYTEPEALKIAIDYIKPAPSRLKVPYTPYVIPFDYHLINYKVSNLRGAIYTGYQAPWVFQEGIFNKSTEALNTNLQFLVDAQRAYEELNDAKGFFAPIYWWDYRDDYGDNEPNTFGIEGNWGNVWGGFQYRTISDVTRVFDKDPGNILAYQILIDFINGMNTHWVDTYTGFPTAFDKGKQPYNNQTDSHMVSNFMRSLVYAFGSSRLTEKDKNVLRRLINKCLDYLDHYRVNMVGFKTSQVEGTWSPNPSQNVWYEYWGGDIIDGLSLLVGRQSLIRE